MVGLNRMRDGPSLGWSDFWKQMGIGHPASCANLIKDPKYKICL